MTEIKFRKVETMFDTRDDRRCILSCNWIYLFAYIIYSILYTKMYIIIYGILYGTFELNIFDSFRMVLISNSIVSRMHFTSDSDPPSTLNVFYSINLYELVLNAIASDYYQECLHKE